MKYSFLIVLAIFMSCESIVFEKDLANTYVNNFDVFWNDFDQHYSFFEQKQIDWDAVYNEYKSQVERINSDTEFYDLLEEIILSLEDGHSNLYALGKVAAFDYTTGFPENNPQFAEDYIDNIKIPNASLTYGDIKNSDLGYLRINTFSGNRSNYEAIEAILPWMENKGALIIDVRDNGGGSDLNAAQINSRFASSNEVYRKVKYRRGSAHSDFTDWIESSVNPAEKTFTKPIALLTNRSCYSATEGFIASLKVFDHVSTVGGTTGGGTGNPIFRELPNGWNFRLSNWVVDYTAFGIVEEIGMTPDFVVEITENDLTLRRDAILEKAIEILN